MDSARFRGRGTGRGQRTPQQQGGQPPAQRRGWGPPPPENQPVPTPQPENPPRPEPGFRGRGDVRTQPSVISHQMTQMSLGGGEGASGGVRGGEPSRGLVRQRPVTLVTKPPDLGPKQGKTGKVVMITSNSFVVQTKPEWALYQYRVDFDPDEDRTIVRRALLRPHKETLGSHIFDGTVLYTIRRLAEPCELMTERKEGTKVKISVKLTTNVMRSDPQYMQFLNLIFRKCLVHLGLQLVGRDYYDPQNRVIIRDHNLEVWPGYLASMKQAENNVLLCVDLSHKVMRNETALELLNTCRQRERNGSWQDLFANSIIGTTVITRYNNKTYRVDDIDWKSTPLSTFAKKDAQVSYMDYYREKYQIDIRERNQPLLVSVPKARDVRAGQNQNIVLVPELCCLTGITDEMRSNFRLMSAMGEHTRIRPSNRIAKLERGFMGLMRGTQAAQDVLREWDLNISDKLVQFHGRILDNEIIYFKGDTKVQTDKRADFTRALQGVAMYESAPINSWVIMYPSRIGQDVRHFVQTLIKSASSFHYRIPEPQREEIRDDKPGTYTMAIERVVNSSNPNLIMCIVPNQRADRYEAIKKKCYVDRSVPNQVVLGKNVTSKNMMSICTKIAIQLNCKLGGAPWMVGNPFSKVPTMICGFDVCHDTRSKEKSFGALVCSINNTYSRYFSAVSAHANGEELSNDLALQFVKAVTRFRENYQVFPARIIFYRDGVGDGNIPYVLQQEVALIENRLKELTGSVIPMTVVIVSKRINTRLFVNQDNAPPGTIADDVITSPERFDFFLVSQSVNQGTVSPTSYNVIYNTAKLSPDIVQRLSYKMTHMYYNWSGTVRVPAQCQFAHKLAFLVSQYLHRVPNSGMEDILYFL